MDTTPGKLYYMLSSSHTKEFGWLLARVRDNMIDDLDLGRVAGSPACAMELNEPIRDEGTGRYTLVGLAPRGTLDVRDRSSCRGLLGISVARQRDDVRCQPKKSERIWWGKTNRPRTRRRH